MENVPGPYNTREIVPSHPEIDEALRQGNRLHGFRAGGGLRVVTMENEAGETVAYGEAPHIEEALEHAALDYRLGHEPYEQQYGGEDARYTRYLTGAQESSSSLDAHMIAGRKLDARCDPRNGDIAVVLSGVRPAPDIPVGLQEYVMATGSAAKFRHRTITYRLTPVRAASGDIGTTMEVVANPNNLSPYYYDYAKIAAGPTFAEAATAAFGAPEVEIGDVRHE